MTCRYDHILMSSSLDEVQACVYTQPCLHERLHYSASVRVALRKSIYGKSTWLWNSTTDVLRTAAQTNSPCILPFYNHNYSTFHNYIVYEACLDKICFTCSMCVCVHISLDIPWKSVQEEIILYYVPTSNCLQGVQLYREVWKKSKDTEKDMDKIALRQRYKELQVLKLDILEELSQVCVLHFISSWPVCMCHVVTLTNCNYWRWPEKVFLMLQSYCLTSGR